MHVTIELDDDLVARAAALTGLSDPALLVREGLRALIAREARARLVDAGGRDPAARAAPRGRA